MTVHQEDAIKFITHCLRNNVSIADYGYEVYLQKVMQAFLNQQEGQTKTYDEISPRFKEIYPEFIAATWELCRRGILRPGVRNWRDQATAEGSAGLGYSVTPFGRQWLSEAEHDDFVPTEPERFAQKLAPFRTRLGEGFHQRAQEAIRCYWAHAYLACCVMCGSAAEAVLIAVAKEVKPEEEVLKMYKSGTGRGRVENMVIGQASDHIKRAFQRYTDPIKYWRDMSAHGLIPDVSETEALLAIFGLLRFAQFVAKDHWDELTSGRE